MEDRLPLADKVSWQCVKTTGTKPLARAAHSASLLEDGVTMVVFGGWDGEGAMNSVYVLNTVTMHWTTPECTGSIPAPRNNHAAEVVGSLLYIHGGHNGEEWLSDFFVLNTETWEWRELSLKGTGPSSPRACHSLSFCSGKLLLFGGFDGGSCYNSLHSVDPNALVWQSINAGTRLPTPRNAHAAVVAGNDLVVIGGHSGNAMLTDIQIFDGDAWLDDFRVYGSPPVGLRGHSCSRISENHFLTFGGFDGQERHNHLFLVKLDKQRRTLHWTALESDPSSTPQGRQRHSAVVGHQGSILVFGGFNGAHWLDDLYLLDVSMLLSGRVYGSVQRLMSDFWELFNTGEFTDISLVVKGERLKAHRCILSARCEYFAKMFRSTMRESSSTEIDIEEDWKIETYKVFLEYIYTGRIHNGSIEILCDLLKLADCYGMIALKDTVSICLEDKLQTENVCQILRCADSCQATDLLGLCKSFILRYGAEVARSQGFEELAQSPQLLIEITKLTMELRSSKSDAT